MKRFFDICASCLGFILLLPFFILVAVFIKLDSNGPVFFRQERVGKDFKKFKIIKFRSMTIDSEGRGPQITVGGDRRVTSIGKILRKYKIDELPQLINILKGEMSFVGPRPEVSKYVDLFKEDYRILLKIRPGITDPASLKYSDEETELSFSDNWEDVYINKILPEKIKLSTHYVNKQNNICTDLKLIFKTILKI